VYFVYIYIYGIYILYKTSAKLAAISFLHWSRWNCTHSTWFNLHDLFLKNILKYMDMFVLLI